MDTFLADSDAPPFATARTLPALAPASPREVALMLGPAYHDDRLAPLVLLAAYQSGGGAEAPTLVPRLLGRGRSAAGVASTQSAAAIALLKSLGDSANNDPPLDPLLVAEISRLLEELRNR